MAFSHTVRIWSVPLRWDWRWLLLIAIMPACALALAQGASLERQIKAAYLVKFAGFVEWPEGSFARGDSALVIGVLGAEALAGQLEQSVAGHSANGRPLQVRKLKKGETPGGVHILFLGAMDKAALQEVMAAARSLPLLTVSDTEEVYAMGSIINFVVTGDRLRFEVALKPAAAARLRIGARMLSAAYKVQQGAS